MPLYNREEIAYMAGLFDGEGCIQISKGRELRRKKESRQYNPSVVIGMTDIEGINIFVKHFDGNIRFVDRKTSEKKWKDVYIWSANSYKNIKKVLKTLLPFLIIKKKQAELMLKYVDSREKTVISTKQGHSSYTNKQLEIISKIKKSNKKGR